MYVQNVGLFYSCVKAVCVVCIYTRAMVWRSQLDCFMEENIFLVYNVEQRETGIVLVKLYEYSVKYVSTETTLF